MAQHVYHWKHGWIPLTHTAALQKAKGNKTLAAKYVKAAPEARGIQSRQDVAGAIRDLPNVPSEHRAGPKAEIQRAAARHGAEDLLPKPLRGGEWRAGTFEHDGSPAGKKAAAKVKQSFTLGNAKVHIEADMTHEQTQALLTDVADVLRRSGHKGPVTFHVPTGDRKFGSKTSITGGYVTEGTTVVRLNPIVANGSADRPDVTAQLAKQLMPGAAAVGYRKWTIAHELGHVVDHSHTHVMPHVHDHNGRLITSRVSEDAKGIHKNNRGGLSRYGQTNPTEGYAEVFAEFTLGTRTPLVMSYAERYGWT